jgi:hypothetical protein
MYRNNTDPEERYASFDYCYNYFKTEKYLTFDLEKSCLVLGFYLSSWGMYRGSGFLMQKSLQWYKPLIDYIDTLNKSVWEIDVDKYNTENVRIILDIYRNICQCFIPEKNQDTTLVTKIMLGVFGFIPAFDTYFSNYFRNTYYGLCGFRSLNINALRLIKSFYDANKTVIDRLSSETFTIDFGTGQLTTINYPKAKIIDMYGFMSGLDNYRKDKEMFNSFNIHL